MTATLLKHVAVKSIAVVGGTLAFASPSKISGGGRRRAPTPYNCRLCRMIIGLSYNGRPTCQINPSNGLAVDTNVTDTQTDRRTDHSRGKCVGIGRIDCAARSDSA